MNSKTPLLIYNLFPRHFPSIAHWHRELPKVADMGFNTVFMNPVQQTGWSGSLYAIKDYFRINPLFLEPGADPADWRPMREFVRSCNERGISVAMDLVINHTAFDSVVAREHPTWFKRDENGKIVSPHAIDPDDDAKITVWGDLAEIDNDESPDRDELWAYWDKVVGFLQNVGVHGFRCDAAYKVPRELWCYLIGRAKARRATTFFLAETLGCRLEEIARLRGTGFDYLFNSSKYWDFDKPWCLEQHESHKPIAPSISFPESHDTERLAAQAPGTIEVQQARYAFAAVFSRGLMMPMGYERGARTRMDVVKGSPDDVDPPRWDLTEWIGQVNRLKLSVPVLGVEGAWDSLTPYEAEVMFLEKTGDSAKDRVVLAVNKRHDREQSVARAEMPQAAAQCIRRTGMLHSPQERTLVGEQLTLSGSEIALLWK